MTVWILERDVFDEACVTAMIAHCQAHGLSHRLIRIAPSELVLEGRAPALPPGEPVVCYASIGAEVLAARMGWRPGVFAGDFTGASARRHLGRDCLNCDAVAMPLSQVAARFDTRAQAFFVKPDADTKEFAGRVFAPGAFEPWLAEMRRIGYLPAEDFAVAVSAPKDVAEEYRLVVVDGRIVAGSLYKRAGHVRLEPDFPRDALQAFITTLEARFKPAAVYDADVATTPDGWRLVEYSTFNTSALYACDVGAVIDAVTASVEGASEGP